MKPSPIFWAVTETTSLGQLKRCRVRGDTYEDALLRAKQFGFANPDSVVRETDITVLEMEKEVVDNVFGHDHEEKIYASGITKRIVGEKK
jgi:hypothetical protein